MQVFKQCIAEQVFIFSVSNDGRDRIKPSKFACAQTSFTHNELIPSLWLFLEEVLERLRRLLIKGNAPNHDRLQDTDFSNRSREFVQVVFIEDLARLTRIGNNLFKRDLCKCSTGHLHQIRCFT